MFSSYFNFNLTNPRQGKQTTITYALSIFASYTTFYNNYADLLIVNDILHKITNEKYLFGKSRNSCKPKEYENVSKEYFIY